MPDIQVVVWLRDAARAEQERQDGSRIDGDECIDTIYELDSADLFTPKGQVSARGKRVLEDIVRSSTLRVVQLPPPEPKEYRLVVEPQSASPATVRWLHAMCKTADHTDGTADVFSFFRKFKAAGVTFDGHIYDRHHEALTQGLVARDVKHTITWHQPAPRR